MNSASASLPGLIAGMFRQADAATPAMPRRYQETGNRVQAVSATLRLVQLRVEAQDAIRRGADKAVVSTRFLQKTGQAL